MLENAIIFLLLVVLVAMASAKKISDSRELKRRVERIKQRKSNTPRTIQELSLRRKAVENQGLAYWLLKPFPNSKRMEDLLERAKLTITPKQFIMRCLGIVVAVFVLIYVIFKKPFLLAVIAALLLGVFIPFKWLQRRVAKQSKAFLSMFPEAIDLIVRGLRSGLPVSESIVQVASEMQEPIAGVFSHVSNNMKLGVPLEKALMETAKKLELQEFFFFTTSIILQRETGGNLSEILNNLSEVLRSRFAMRMKIHALTSEARSSAMIIGSMPFIVGAAISYLNPNYMQPLIQESGGNQALAVAAIMLSGGMWIMNKMTKFEI